MELASVLLGSSQKSVFTPAFKQQKVDYNESKNDILYNAY
ncbi:hypothetical protein PB1E_1161 [Leuconostoc gelidum subsp. gasicomitatum]|nr:hypothetical protein PB1E_1161 [Leuconostoc gasicomitatum]